MSGEIGLEKSAVEDHGLGRHGLALLYAPMKMLTCENHQVLLAIVGLIFIDVMDHFRGKQKSSNNFFYDNPMFVNKSVLCRMRMARGDNAHITINTRPAAFPERACGPGPIFPSFTAFLDKALMFSGKNTAPEGFADFSLMFGGEFLTFAGGAHIGPGFIRHRASLQALVPGRFSHMRKANFTLRFFGKYISLFTAMIGNHIRYGFGRMTKTFLYHFNTPYNLIISQFTYISQLFTLRDCNA